LTLLKARPQSHGGMEKHQCNSRYECLPLVSLRNTPTNDIQHDFFVGQNELGIEPLEELARPFNFLVKQNTGEQLSIRRCNNHKEYLLSRRNDTYW
jgi:hypothetical protein